MVYTVASEMGTWLVDKAIINNRIYVSDSKITFLCTTRIDEMSNGIPLPFRKDAVTTTTSQIYPGPTEAMNLSSPCYQTFSGSIPFSLRFHYNQH